MEDDEGFVLVSAGDAYDNDDQDFTLSDPPSPSPSPDRELDSNSISRRERDDHPPPEYLPEIDKAINSLADALWPLNTFIHSHPELAFKEHQAHDALTGFMRSQKDPSWEVTPSAYGLETAWTAVYDSGKPGPVVAFNAEMDALPDIGHACGHNLIATVSVSAALATAKIMHRSNSNSNSSSNSSSQPVGGKVILLGTPGEEGTIGGKILLLDRGAYYSSSSSPSSLSTSASTPLSNSTSHPKKAKPQNTITLISHPSLYNNSPEIHTAQFSRLTASYTGVPSHAANTPWLARNALDATITSYTSLSLLRQQTHPSTILSLAIPDSGSPLTNIIHSHSKLTIVARSHPVQSQSSHSSLEAKIASCLRAGGLATGCETEIEITEGYRDHVPNLMLARRYASNWNSIPLLDDKKPPSDPDPNPQIPIAEDRPVYVNASTDQGNLSHAMPSINVSFAIPPGPEGGPPHTPDFVKAAGTREAFERALGVGKALAGTAVDVLTIPGLFEEVKAQWRRDMDAVKQRERNDPSKNDPSKDAVVFAEAPRREC